MDKDKPTAPPAGGKHAKEVRREAEVREGNVAVRPLYLRDCCPRCKVPFDDCRCD